MIEVKTMKTIVVLFVMIAMLLPAILLAGCDSGQEDVIIDDGSAEVVLPDEQTEDEEEVLPFDEPDVTEEDDPVPSEEDEDDYIGDNSADITGTYSGTATATETEYFRVKENLYFNRIKVGTTKDLMLTVILDETTGKYYIDGAPAEKTELPDGDIYLESTAEYEGSMSKTITLSLYFIQDGKVITGTMNDLTFVYGAIAAKEIWSITATKQ